MIEFLEAQNTVIQNDFSKDAESFIHTAQHVVQMRQSTLETLCGARLRVRAFLQRNCHLLVSFAGEPHQGRNKNNLMIKRLVQANDMQVNCSQETHTRRPATTSSSAVGNGGIAFQTVARLLLRCHARRSQALVPVVQMETQMSHV